MTIAPSNNQDKKIDSSLEEELKDFQLNGELDPKISLSDQTISFLCSNEELRKKFKQAISSIETSITTNSDIDKSSPSTNHQQEKLALSEESSEQTLGINAAEESLFIIGSKPTVETEELNRPPILKMLPVALEKHPIPENAINLYIQDEDDDAVSVKSGSSSASSSGSVWIMEDMVEPTSSSVQKPIIMKGESNPREPGKQFLVLFYYYLIFT